MVTQIFRLMTFARVGDMAQFIALEVKGRLGAVFGAEKTETV